MELSQEAPLVRKSAMNYQDLNVDAPFLFLHKTQSTSELVSVQADLGYNSVAITQPWYTCALLTIEVNCFDLLIFSTMAAQSMQNCILRAQIWRNCIAPNISENCSVRDKVCFPTLSKMSWSAILTTTVGRRMLSQVVQEVETISERIQIFYKATPRKLVELSLL